MSAFLLPMQTEHKNQYEIDHQRTRPKLPIDILRQKIKHTRNKKGLENSLSQFAVRILKKLHKLSARPYRIKEHTLEFQKSYSFFLESLIEEHKESTSYRTPYSKLQVYIRTKSDRGR